MRNDLGLAAFIAILFATSACGGSGGGVNSTPPPPPGTQPTQPPITGSPLNPSGALLPAMQTPSPPSPVATGDTPTFSSLGSTTTFPMLMTAVDATFGGDSVTTAAGGTLSANPNGTFALSLANPALDVSGVPVTTYPGAGTSAFFYVASKVDGADLDYTRFGYWIRYQPSEGMFNSGAWTAGFVTPASDIPTQGTATYSGQASGLYNDAGACNCSNQFVSPFTGDVNLTANFTNQTLNGSITNILLTPVSLTAGPMNNIGFTASIDRSSNLFAGTTSVTSQPGGSWAFGPTASGSINGRFYGPGSSNVGAVFSLTEGIKRLIGSFGASRIP